MNIYNKFNILYLFAVLITSLLFMQFAAAAGIKNNDQQLSIKVGPDGCAISVDLISELDNCAESEFARNCGKHGKDCVCMKNHKFVSWVIDNDARFELTFKNANPLKPNCAIKSGNNQRIRCKIDAENGDYDYDLIIETCPGQVYDPRIVVR